MNKTKNKNYDRVMPRVYNQSRTSVNSGSNVLRHDIPYVPSSVRVGAKPSVSNVSSRVFSELPTVLNDYVPESNREKVRRSNVVKPRRTIKSLDPAKSPPRIVPKLSSDKGRKPSNIAAGFTSLSSIANRKGYSSDSHIRQCYSSRSHLRLKEIKDEIKQYHETEKLLSLRSKLYKKCGVVLDDVGQVTVNKGTQAEEEVNVPDAVSDKTVRLKSDRDGSGRQRRGD